jgi:hypothetical protein
MIKLTLGLALLVFGSAFSISDKIADESHS